MATVPSGAEGDVRPRRSARNWTLFLSAGIAGTLLVATIVLTTSYMGSTVTSGPGSRIDLDLNGGGTSAPHLTRVAKIANGLNRYGCRTPAQFSQIDQYNTFENQIEFQRILTGAMLDHLCVSFVAGETVYPLDGPDIPGLVQIRRKSDAKVYWTSLASAG